LLVLHSHVLVGFAAVYYLTGRFNPEHEYQSHSAFTAGKEDEQASWAAYKERFPSILAEAVRDGVLTREKNVNSYFRTSEHLGKVALDGNGQPILALNGERVGLTRSTILQPDSDPLTAERLMLARVNATLKEAPKNRESLQEFQQDWQILESLQRKNAVVELAGTN
jgi:hypothetical protein